MFRDNLDFGAEFPTEKHFGATACVEARNAAANETDTHAFEGFHRLRRANAAEELFRRVVRSGLCMDMEIGDVEPPHVVRVHVCGAE